MLLTFMNLLGLTFSEKLHQGLPFHLHVELTRHFLSATVKNANKSMLFKIQHLQFTIIVVKSPTKHVSCSDLNHKESIWARSGRYED